MENAKHSFKIDVIRAVNLPFIQEEMALCWMSDEMTSGTGNTANTDFNQTTII